MGTLLKKMNGNNTAKRLKEMFHLLLIHFGKQRWWPAETQLEMMIGAILTQNTNWNNVVKVLENLKRKSLLTFQALSSLHVTEIAQEIRPVGYYNIKANRLKNFINFVTKDYGGNLSRFFSDDTHKLRQGLLTVNGIGPETADSILLYAAQRPVFVVDAYTHRILHRHGMVEEMENYDSLQALFTDHLRKDVDLFNEFHALIVKTGKRYCKKRPHCTGCPLRHWGPITPAY